MTMDRGWRIVRGISLRGLRGHRRQETDRARWIRFVPFMLFIFSLISCFLFFGVKKRAGRHGSSDSCLANFFVVCRCGWPGRDRQGSRAWPVEYEQAKPSHRHPSCRDDRRTPTCLPCMRATASSAILSTDRAVDRTRRLLSDVIHPSIVARFTHGHTW